MTKRRITFTRHFLESRVLGGCAFAGHAERNLVGARRELVGRRGGELWHRWRRRVVEPFAKPVWECAKAAGVRFAKLMVLTEATVWRGQEPVEARPAFEHATPSEPGEEYGLRRGKRPISLRSTERLSIEDFVPKDAMWRNPKIAVAIALEGLSRHFFQQMIEHDVPPSSGAGVEAFEQVAADLVPRPSDLTAQPATSRP